MWGVGQGTGHGEVVRAKDRPITQVVRERIYSTQLTMHGLLTITSKIKSNINSI